MKCNQQEWTITTHSLVITAKHEKWIFIKCDQQEWTKNTYSLAIIRCKQNKYSSCDRNADKLIKTTVLLWVDRNENQQISNCDIRT